METWKISDVRDFTGLSERTIRSYLAHGIVKAIKEKGRYVFTLRDIESLLADPYVKPAILAKERAAVLDFLSDEKEGVCLLIRKRFPNGIAANKLGKGLCGIANKNDGKFFFSFDEVDHMAKAVFSGSATALHEAQALLNAQATD